VVCPLIHALSLVVNLSLDIGKLVQIEHALAAVSQGTTSLGIKGNVCSVSISLGTNKPILTSYKWNRNRDREEILVHPCGRVRDRQSLCDMSQHWDRVFWNGARLSCLDCQSTQECPGILEDIRRVSPNAGSRSVYRNCDAGSNTIRVSSHNCPSVICTNSSWFPKRSGVRPFGVSLLVAGWDSHRGPTLYQVDPSGSYWAWKASAIGKNMTNAKTFLEKR
jgi:hypothetical protein